MTQEKLRQRIASEAARLIVVREESAYFRAKLKAAQHVCGGHVPSSHLPTNREIRDRVRSLKRRGEIVEDTPPRRTHHRIDRFRIFEMLLAPLEGVREHPDQHPEGDALYHSLQVFHLVCQQCAYDEELLLAALLHDVGKAIDRKTPVEATLEVLMGLVTPRTAWLIENHPDARRFLDGTLGARARRRLETADDFDEVLLLAECDRDGRARGAEAPDLNEALDYLRQLEAAEDAETY